MRKEVEAIDGKSKEIILKSDHRIAITADTWTSVNANCSLLAITAHTAQSGFEERSNIVLDCVSLEDGSHTAAVLEEKIRRSLSRLEIDMSKVSFFVADGATVMKSTAMNLNLKYVQCCAHVINLAAKAAIESECVKQTVQKVRKIVAKLNRSGKIKSLFKRLLQEANLPQVLPYTDCPTRWGSTYTMICDVLSLLPAVENLIIHLKLQPFEKEEIRLLEAIEAFMAPFFTMTKQVCSQGSCVSMYIPVGKILIASTRKNCNSAKRDARQFGDTLLSKLRNYFDDWFEDETLQLASLMDPRFAFMETVLPSETWTKTIEKLNRLNVSKAVEELEVQCSQECQSFCKETPVWAVLNEGQETSVANLTTKEDDFEIEIKQYAILLKRARPTFDSDPLEWWRSHHAEFPQIAAIVPQYLVCPASSVDCERLFSLAGIIYGNKRRSNLKGDNARLLLMLKTRGNVEVGRPSKAWSPAEARRYGNPPKMSDVFGSEEDASSSEDESTYASDEDEDEVEQEEEEPAYLE